MIKVFFNNSCKVCKLEIDHYKKTPNSEIEWIDITNNIEAEQLTKKTAAQLLRRLHVVEKGEVIEGAKAFLVLWSKMPKYYWLYKLLSFKPLFIIFHTVYEGFAYFLFLKNKKQSLKN